MNQHQILAALDVIIHLANAATLWRERSASLTVSGIKLMVIASWGNLNVRCQDPLVAFQISIDRQLVSEANWHPFGRCFGFILDQTVAGMAPDAVEIVSVA